MCGKAVRHMRSLRLRQRHTTLTSCLSYFLKVNDSNCDQELLSLLLDAKLLVKCISTPFYPRLVQHLLASPQPGRWDTEELARLLREAGHEAEAGSLLLASRGTHRALRTFSMALGAGQHWIWTPQSSTLSERGHRCLCSLEEEASSWTLFPEAICDNSVNDSQWIPQIANKAVNENSFFSPYSD